MSHRFVGVLRRLAPWLVRGPDAPLVLADLEEAWARDLARGIPRTYAALRYARNLTASALALGWARLRWPGLGASLLERIAPGAGALRSYPPGAARAEASVRSRPLPGRPGAGTLGPHAESHFAKCRTADP